MVYQVGDGNIQEILEVGVHTQEVTVNVDSLAGEQIYMTGTISASISAPNIAVGTSLEAVGFYGVAPVIRGASLLPQSEIVLSSAPITPTYTIFLTDVAPFGFVSQDAGATVIGVISNLQARLAELEGRLIQLGLIHAP